MAQSGKRRAPTVYDHNLSHPSIEVRKKALVEFFEDPQTPIKLRKSIWSFVCDYPDDIEDILQNAYIHLYKCVLNRDYDENTANFYTYAKKAVYNEAVSYTKRIRELNQISLENLLNPGDQELDEFAEPKDNTASPEQKLIFKEYIERFKKALSAKDFTIVINNCCWKSSQKEIANMLMIHSAAAKKAIFRSMKRARKIHLEDQ
jgi:RNA polymerase sigma factor (sigma-70 family)